MLVSICTPQTHPDALENARRNMRQGNLLPSLNKKEEAAGSGGVTGGKSVPRRGGGGNRRELVRKQEASQRALEREQHLMAARERGLVEAWHDKFAHMSDTQLLRRCRDELFVFDSYHFPPLAPNRRSRSAWATGLGAITKSLDVMRIPGRGSCSPPKGRRCP